MSEELKGVKEDGEGGKGREKAALRVERYYENEK